MSEVRFRSGEVELVADQRPGAAAGRTPVLLLHGLGADAGDWARQLPALTDRDLWLPDLRGYGRSRAAPGPYRPAVMAEDCLALLDHAGVACADVVGHSMGGAVALELALAAPSRLRRLVLVNSLADFRLRGPRRQLEYWLRRLLIAAVGLPRLARLLARRSFPHADQAALREEVSARLAANDEAIYRETLEELVRWSVSERLGELRVATLIVTGDRDISPLADKQRMLAALPDAELEVVMDSGHGTPLGRPDEFNRILRSFLDRSAGAEEDLPR